jgi:carbon storage regulator
MTLRQRGFSHGGFTVLILSRKRSQVIYVGDYRVVVVGIHGDRVSLGVDAPPEVLVLRGELRPGRTDPDREQPGADADAA